MNETVLIGSRGAVISKAPSAKGFHSYSTRIDRLGIAKAEPYEIECLDCVKVLALPISLWAQELNAIILHGQQTEELLSIVNNEKIHARLLEFLIWLAHKFSQRVNQGQLLKLPLTYQEIAESIATTRVTVTRMLGILEQEGKIIRNRHQLILPYDLFISNNN